MKKKPRAKAGTDRRSRARPNPKRKTGAKGRDTADNGRTRRAKKTSPARAKRAAQPRSGKRTGGTGARPERPAATNGRPQRRADDNETKGNRERDAAQPRPKAVRNQRRKDPVPEETPAPTIEIDGQTVEIFSEDHPLPKTKLPAKELREFKALLLAKRHELCGDMEQLTDEALLRSKHGERDHTSMPIHMADLGSDNWEQDFNLGLLANERAIVREIDEALARIQNKTYGICLATHRPIGLARLRAKPWAKYCIEYARAKEEGRVR